MNLLKNKELLHILINQANLLNTVNGGVSGTYIEMVEKDDKIIIEIDAPTVEPDSFKIMLNFNQLTVFSTLKDESVSEIELYSVPMFLKTFELPAFVDYNSIEALYEDNQLKIILPFSTDINNMNRIIEVKYI